MLINYLKIAIRNILKTKVHSFINVFGLSLGIACSILIILFVKDEWTFDKFHSKSNRIFRPWTESERPDGEMIVNTVTAFPMGPSLKDNYAEVENFTVINRFGEQIEYNDASFQETITLVSSAFFEIFDFDVLMGSVHQVFDGQNNIVITREMAEKYFATEDPIDKFISIMVGGEKRNFAVKAVTSNPPSNSSIQYQFLISDLNAKYIFPERMITSWNMISGSTYISLKEGVDAGLLETKLPEMVDQIMGERLGERKFGIHLQPITDIHLNTDLPPGLVPISDPKYTYMLMGIAILILAIACINFMTLSIGRSISRAKEIGIRKVVGARKRELIKQFMSEALLISFIGLLFGLLIAYLFLPLFNELSGKSLMMEVSLINVMSFVGLTLIVGIIAGFYPAIVMSAFQPIKILKGSLGVGRGKQSIRKYLVISQFVLSIFLVTSTLFMKKQLNYIQNKNLGYNKEQVITIPLNVNARGIRDGITKGFEKSLQFKNVLENMPEVLDVGLSAHSFGRGNWIEIGYNEPGGTMEKFSYNIVDEDFISTMQMELVLGRDFSRDIQADQIRSVIVNQSFVEYFKLEDPVGKRIPSDGFIDHEIIGVLKDFNFESLHGSISPLLLAINTNIGFSGAQQISIGSSATPKFFVRLQANQVGEGIKAVQSKWEEVYPGEAFNFDFIDDTLNAQYVQEQNLGKIVMAAATLAIIIGCMGLFGLATLTIAGRTKEISIRKILGASENTIIYLLTRSYVGMIVTSMLIAAPFTYYFVDNWLQQFEFRVSLNSGVFLLAGGITLIIAIITIGFQCVKVAFVNPVNSLRTE